MEEEKQQELQKFQAIINWTLPGLQMFYWGAQLPARVIEKYVIGYGKVIVSSHPEND